MFEKIKIPGMVHNAGEVRVFKIHPLGEGVMVFVKCARKVIVQDVPDSSFEFATITPYQSS